MTTDIFDQLCLDFIAEDSLILKFKHAIEINLLKFNFPNELLAQKKDILDRVNEFLLHVCHPTVQSISPSEFLPVAKYIKSSVVRLETNEQRTPKKIPEELSIGKKAAYVTSRNPDILIWKQIGNAKVTGFLSDKSEEDNEVSLNITLSGFTRQATEFISDEVKQLLISANTKEVIDKINHLLLAIGGRQEAHRIWSYQKIVASIVTSRINKLELNPNYNIDYILAILMIRTLDNSPIICCGLLDFSLAIDDKVKRSELSAALNPILQLVWLNLALKLFDLAVNRLNLYNQELSNYGIAIESAQTYFLMLAIFCVQKIDAKYNSLHDLFKPNIEQAFDIISGHPNVLAKALEFLFFAEQQAKEHNPDFNPSKMYKTKFKGFEYALLSMYGYFAGFLTGRITTVRMQTADCVSSTIVRFFSLSQIRATELSKHKEVTTHQSASITQLTQDLSDARTSSSELQVKHTRLGVELKKLKTCSEKTTLSLELASQRNTQLSTKCTKQAADLAKLSIAQKKTSSLILSIIDTIYGQLSEFALQARNDSKPKILDSIRIQINKLHIVLFSSRDHLQDTFNIFFTRYLILVYDLCKAILDKAIHTAVDCRTKNYLSSLDINLLKHHETRLFLDDTYTDLFDHSNDTNLTPVHIPKRRLQTSYNYIIGIQLSLSKNLDSLILPINSNEMLKFMIYVGKLFNDNKLIVYVASPAPDPIQESDSPVPASSLRIS